MQEHICKGNDLGETAAHALLGSLPASLKNRLDEALAAGASKQKILNHIRQKHGGESLLFLAIEEYMK